MRRITFAFACLVLGCGCPASPRRPHPFASALACMDSRAPVGIVFDPGLGDVFGFHVAGNAVNADELGSFGYSVKVGAI